MKKILTIAAMALTAGSIFAQDKIESDLKNFRFGLKITPSVNWYKPDGKLISPNGPTAKFGGGLITEFRLTKVISFQTGAQIDLDGGNIKYNNGGTNNPGSNTVHYYYNNVDDVIANFDPVLANSPAHTHYQLNERIYRVTYVTIPLTLKMKTKEIGSLIYFGQIGVNNSFRWKATADDKLTVINDATNTLGATDGKSKIDITKDISVYTASLNFGLGGEMNLSGSTSLTFGLNYLLGFMNVVKSTSVNLEKRVNDPINPTVFTEVAMPQSVKSNAVVLTVGVLF